MAETPKDKDTDETVIDGTATSLEGGAAPEAADAIAEADEDPAGAPDSVSAGDAGDHVSGGEDVDALTGGSAAGPWSAPAVAGSGTASDPATDATPEAAPNPAPNPAPARPATKTGGGVGRLIVVLILIVLVSGVGYATYPEWREQALPYAEMAGITLPPVPGEVAGEPSETEPAAPVPAVEASGDADPSTDPAHAVEAPAPSAAQTTENAPAATSATTPASTPGTTAGAAAVPTVSAEDFAEDFAALSERLRAVEAEVAALSDREAAASATGSPDQDAVDTGALADRVDALESRLIAVSDEMAIVRQGLGSAETTDGIAEVTSGLADRLAELDARLSVLEQAPAAPAASPRELEALSGRIDDLDGRMDARMEALTSRIETLAAGQTDLSGRVAQGRDAQERAGAFLLASNLLAAATSGSGGFAPALDAVERAAPEGAETAAAVAALRPHADGVASVADLRARFPAVAASVIDASIVGADDGVVGTALTRIAALVTLRRTETAEGNDIDAIVNRAEAAANAGDLKTAVDALSALDGDPSKVAAAWLGQAEARIAVDDAVRTLQARALAAVSGG